MDDQGTSKENILKATFSLTPTNMSQRMSFLDCFQRLELLLNSGTEMTGLFSLSATKLGMPISGHSCEAIFPAYRILPQVYNF